jgi:hypothetical protein
VVNSSKCNTTAFFYQFKTSKRVQIFSKIQDSFFGNCVSMRFQQSYQSVSYKYLVDVCRCNICLCLLILYSTKLHILWYYYHKTVNLSLCFTKLHISHPLYHNRFYISCVPAYPMHEIRPPSLV